MNNLINDLQSLGSPQKAERLGGDKFMNRIIKNSLILTAFIISTNMFCGLDKDEFPQKKHSFYHARPVFRSHFIRDSKTWTRRISIYFDSPQSAAQRWIREIEIWKRQKAILTFLCVFHQRAGSQSAARVLPQQFLVEKLKRLLQS